MNTKKDWELLTLPFNEELNEALQQQHHAPQYIALVGHYLIPQKADDSNTNMEYIPAGGYRMDVGIFPNNKDLIEDVLKITGSTYSCVAAPIQYAAIVAYSQDPEIENYIDDCAQIHATIGQITSARLNKIEGVNATIPKGAFYLLVDFNEYSEQLKKIGFNSCAEFCEHLVGVEHTALLPGNSLLLPEDDFSVRLSYVDFNGDDVLKAWQQNRPHTDQEKEDFFEASCPLVA